ncbi:MAG: hypothetical protein UX85_C0003G0181 [Candidatus Beckwithbacteria bacterium GW2011_GWB1_47_15]|uniref:Glycosyltransferase RgtA/B/C/D-like domain-containing protein n=1 Tax=Candidatus Beckwithbacteria bacterium GW2011_GWB1_47_15 TaxID=1618371 RepID=A0A0G1RWK7_9BACT|nr:MAG: hypothetical protein UY43_C0001G0279 [Candidatus Beckwithbacteria bacterium GW2011_GWC1_49_16]KKU35200.1 MAG: hypothetical protein UX50_C0005G0023 [Candidatus Beckwithbacteria bacterium GW2011_GWA1_46_30]KKU61522.1 MAG: hypothetical protein UX85_C0003G0181 [Candidatus Beckwithbacteria bacterium GW2011_GWB1_47_15]KKU71726.1 MAG: hypothetical protein UX97_C0004G0049 [Candidatus Beckwithbacteria bacterium GW2011_GWA2_47_25]KKW03824.1 MAG: hypothetical protein UY37_C0004G0117 [Candidatus Be
MRLAPKFWWGLGLVLILHGVMFWVKQSQNPLWYQQDNYVGYARGLIEGGGIDQPWLFPGLAMLIAAAAKAVGSVVVAATGVAAISLAAIYALAYLMTYDWLFAAMISLFPPIVFEQTSKVSTTGLVVAGWLGAYYLYSKRRGYWASLVTVLSALVRPVAVILGVAWLIDLGTKGKYKEALINGLILGLFPMGLWLFNRQVFGEGVFYQAKMYQTLGPVRVGIVQFGRDILRAVDWGYWRILASGLTYLGLSLVLVGMIIKSRAEVLIKWWAGLTLVYVLAVGPEPLLEEFRRYIAVLFPLGLVVLYPRFKPYRLVLGVLMVMSLAAFW